MHRRSEMTAFNTVDHPHREYLIARFRSHEPIQTFLEIGCDCGENLIHLSKKYSKARIHGIDINRKAVELGRQVMAKRGFDNVRIEAGKADDLSQFSDKSIDVIFSDACLMYVGPDKIRCVIAECERVATKGIIFNEWHFDRSDPTTVCHEYHFAHWVYDYRRLIRENFPNARVNITKIPDCVWGGPGWKEFGSIVEMSL